MTGISHSTRLQALLHEAHRFDESRQYDKAERSSLQILEVEPGNVQASLLAGRLAAQRGDLAGAASLLQAAHQLHSDDPDLAIQLGLARAACGELAAASVPLEQVVARRPELPRAWLMLSLVRDRLGDRLGALIAAFQAVTRAQKDGSWLDEASTPPELLGPVVQAIERVRLGRRELLLDAYADLRARHGNDALLRMDRALAGYLKDQDVGPTHPRQRPLFMHFPDIPSPAYHDPGLQPWAARLRSAFVDIRREALALIQQDVEALPHFVGAMTSEARAKYVSGLSANPAWQAFFFYRRGKRYADNHARCPVTSEVLDSLDLCRIPAQAPEICFSVLRPQSQINAHHGVSNIRLVMHLPLIVPPDCALNLVDAGTHHWREGELVMFDDTYLHEAWNRSDKTRVILLMDCWNPYLTAVERQACAQLIDRVSRLKNPDSQGTGYE